MNTPLATTKRTGTPTICSAMRKGDRTVGTYTHFLITTPQEEPDKEEDRKGLRFWALQSPARDNLQHIPNLSPICCTGASREQVRQTAPWCPLKPLLRPPRLDQTKGITTDSSRPAPQDLRNQDIDQQWIATGILIVCSLDQRKRPLRHDGDVNDLFEYRQLRNVSRPPVVAPNGPTTWKNLHDLHARDIDHPRTN